MKMLKPRNMEDEMNGTEQYLNEFQSKANEGDVERIAKNLHAMRKGPVAKVWETVQALWALVKDPKAGWGSKSLAIAALVYLVSPIDAIPDIIPVLGLTDDAAVLIATAAKISKDLRPYLNK
ncbi:DUF1232 domain-containing protein [Candidatus Micrarchaeota archaeon]|nr:DUF1232 domain-containing protein [Candidatus Micrarchaeota archaeon]